MNRLVSFIVAISVIGSAEAQPRRAAPAAMHVRVAAASDLQFAFDEAIARLEAAQPALDVEATYGSSGNFHAQLGHRAPFDLYLSADVAYPQDLVARGIGAAEDLFVYGVGHLVLWVRTGSPLRIDEGLAALAGVRRLAIANPRHAPYGRAAEAALRRAGLWEQLRPRLLLGDNIAQTAQFVEAGAADAALLAKSLAVAPVMRGKGRYRDVPSSTHPPLVQGGLVLPWARSRTGALLVRDYLLGVEGQRLLASFGLAPADAPTVR